jgi:hypothetical protein
MSNERKALTNYERKLAERVKRIWLRKKNDLGLSQERAAEQIGLTQGGLNHLLNGRRPINIEMVLKFSALLDETPMPIAPELISPYAELFVEGADTPPPVEDFLSRMEYVLGPRDKHPWGSALGLKGTRVQSIFKGQIPTAPALEVIHRAENASIDWLLTGEGPPFRVESWHSDEVVASLFTEWGRVHNDETTGYLLTDGHGNATLVATTPTVWLCADDARATYTEVRVFPNAGPLALQAAKRFALLRIVSMEEATLDKVSAGWLGPVHLLNGLLDNYTATSSDEADTMVREAVGRYQVPPADEAEVMGHYRHLETVLRAMDRTYNIMQQPPGEVHDPDSNTESDPVAIDSESTSANQIHTDD